MKNQIKYKIIYPGDIRGYVKVSRDDKEKITRKKGKILDVGIGKYKILGED